MKNGGQYNQCDMHRMHRAQKLVQEGKLRLQPHLITCTIVVWLLVNCGCRCGTDQGQTEIINLE